MGENIKPSRKKRYNVRVTLPSSSCTWQSWSRPTPGKFTSTLASSMMRFIDPVIQHWTIHDLPFFLFLSRPHFNPRFTLCIPESYLLILIWPPLYFCPLATPLSVRISRFDSDPRVAENSQYSPLDRGMGVQTKLEYVDTWLRR